MKKILVILLTVITLAQTNRAGAQVYGSIGFNTFYNELSPYGRWVNDLDYGQVWIANEPGFEPYYSNGHWVYTSYGWTWVSNYRWGWAPFHYGRWTYLPSWGEWAWVPGYEWGPAWVGWCQNDGYYGWAPLGPGMGLNFTFNSIPRNNWRFVQQQYITVPSVRNHIIRPGRDGRVFRNAVVINNRQVNNNVTYLAGPQREAVERVTRRKIESRPVAFTAADEQTKVDNRAVRIYRPELKQQQAADNTAVKPATQPVVAPTTRPALPATRPDERPVTRNQRVKPAPAAPDRSVSEVQPVRKADEPKQVTAPVQRGNEVQQLPPRVTERPDNLRQQRVQQAQERQKQAEMQRANEQQNLTPQREQRDELRVRQAQQEQLRRQQQEQAAIQQQRQNDLRQQQLEEQQARQQTMQQQKQQEQQQLRQQQLQEQRQRQNEIRQQQLQEQRQQQNEQRHNELRQQQQERRQQQRLMQQRQNEMKQQQNIQQSPVRQERIMPMNQRPVRRPNGN